MGQKTIITVHNNGDNKQYCLEDFGKDVISFGRETDCDIMIPNARVSRCHGCFYKDNGRWMIQDLDSRNGITVNDKRIKRSGIPEGSLIYLDKTRETDSVQITVDTQNDQTNPGFSTYSGTSSFPDSKSSAPNSYNSGSSYNSGGSNSSFSSGGSNSSFNSAGSYSSFSSAGSNGSLGSYSSSNSNISSRQTGNKSVNGAVIGIIIAVAAVVVLIVGVVIVVNTRKNNTKVTLELPEDITVDSLTIEDIEEPSTVAFTPITTSAEEPETTEESNTVANASDSSIEEKTETLSSEEIYKIASPSTVEVHAFGYGEFVSTGTGFFEDNNGTIITNYHVIDGTDNAVIITSDEKEYKVTSVIGYDAVLDIAILATEATSTTPLSKRTSEINTGEKIYALGSSDGLTGTFTEGMISTAERELNGRTYIQHTAPITHGNSGGPLLDSYGNVAGINEMVRENGQNLNFAIPISRINEVDRNKKMSLEEVYIAEYGSSGLEYAEEMHNWNAVTVAEDGDRSIEMKLPEEFQLTEDDTIDGSYYVYEKSYNSEIALFPYITKANTYGFDEEAFNSACDEEVDAEVEEIKNEYNVDFDVVAESVYINGDYWRNYTFTLENNGRAVDTYMLFHYDEGSFAQIQIFISGQKNEVEELKNLKNAILSTVKVQ